MTAPDWNEGRRTAGAPTLPCTHRALMHDFPSRKGPSSLYREWALPTGAPDRWEEEHKPKTQICLPAGSTALPRAPACSLHTEHRMGGTHGAASTSCPSCSYWLVLVGCETESRMGIDFLYGDRGDSRLLGWEKDDSCGKWWMIMRGSGFSWILEAEKQEGVYEMSLTKFAVLIFLELPTEHNEDEIKYFSTALETPCCIRKGKNTYIKKANPSIVCICASNFQQSKRNFFKRQL